MKTLINKTTNALSSVVLFTIGLAMAGLGFAVMGTLALFALMGVGLGLVALPFIKTTQNDDMETAAA